ncbi:unnamed protein product [Ectocarpus fasciculatus]
MVGYVAKNGQAFEDRVRKREVSNPTFDFLSPTNKFHAYYKRQLALAKGEPVPPAPRQGDKGGAPATGGSSNSDVGRAPGAVPGSSASQRQSSRDTASSTAGSVGGTPGGVPVVGGMEGESAKPGASASQENGSAASVSLTARTKRRRSQDESDESGGSNGNSADGDNAASTAAAPVDASSVAVNLREKLGAKLGIALSTINDRRGKADDGSQEAEEDEKGENDPTPGSASGSRGRVSAEGKVGESASQPEPEGAEGGRRADDEETRRANRLKRMRLMSGHYKLAVLEHSSEKQQQQQQQDGAAAVASTEPAPGAVSAAGGGGDGVGVTTTPRRTACLTWTTPAAVATRKGEARATTTKLPAAASRRSPPPARGRHLVAVRQNGVIVHRGPVVPTAEAAEKTGPIPGTAHGAAGDQELKTAGAGEGRGSAGAARAIARAGGTRMRLLVEKTGGMHGGAEAAAAVEAGHAVAVSARPAAHQAEATGIGHRGPEIAQAENGATTAREETEARPAVEARLRLLGSRRAVAAGGNGTVGRGGTAERGPARSREVIVRPAAGGVRRTLARRVGVRRDPTGGAGAGTEGRAGSGLAATSDPEGDRL